MSKDFRFRRYRFTDAGRFIKVGLEGVDTFFDGRKTHKIADALIAEGSK